MFPENFTTFDDIPPDYPYNYSELTDDVFIWSAPNRTLTQEINANIQLSEDNINTLASSVNQIILDRIELHDGDIKAALNDLGSSLRQIIGAVVTEVNENQIIIQNSLGNEIKVII